MTVQPKTIALLSLSMSLTACGSGGGGGGNVTPGGGGGGGGGGGNLMPNFASIQTQVFDPICTNCHVGAGAPLGLRLDEANSFALLVGRSSNQCPGFLLVDPGNPDGSCLIRKLEGTAAVGGRMPLDGTPLPAADIEIIRQWIIDGALPPDEETSAPVRVTSLSPLPGQTVAMVPMSITAIFDRELNAATVDENSFLVERSGDDGTFGDGNEVEIVPVSVTVPNANPMTAVFDMSTTPMASDTYRVTLLGTGPAIQDLDSNSLDGEFTSDFPSGDGTAGGDFVATFEVEGIQPTLQSIQDNVFTPTCMGCHTGNGAALPASMGLTDTGTSFMSLVDVPSQDANFDRVEPGQPDNSFLIHKLEDTQSAGTRMPPPPMSQLDQDTIDAIRQWIDDGAAM